MKGGEYQMEKYGVEETKFTYQILVPLPGKEKKYQIIGERLTLPQATDIVNRTPNAIIRPEKD